MDKKPQDRVSSEAYHQTPGAGIGDLFMSARGPDVHIGARTRLVLQRSKTQWPLASQPGAELAVLRNKLAARDAEVTQLTALLTQRDLQVAAMYQSTSWRVTAPMRRAVDSLKWTVRSVAQLRASTARFGGLSRTLAMALNLYRRDGLAGLRRGVQLVATPATSASQIAPARHDYAQWVTQFDTVDESTRGAMRARIAEFVRTPLISILMPVYNIAPEFLEQAIDSVRRQLYPHWELCIADDASTNPAVRPVLERYRALDARIKVDFRATNGHISHSSNSALALAEGEFVALLDHDDLLAEHALYWIVDALQTHPDAGLLYSDEDKITAQGQRYDPYFKPDINYELLLAQNMICHLGVYRTRLLRELGGFRVGFEGAQDYDLALRVIEHLTLEQVVHVPRVLYHWRAVAGSTALAAGEKNYAAIAGRKAVAEHLARVCMPAEVTAAPEAPDLNRVRFACPQPQPLVSIIIPTRDRADLLGMCLDSLIERTSYLNYEVLIVDNGSVEEATRQLFARLPKDRFRIVRDESAFNFSALNNHAARLARGSMLCLMNNDIEILTPDWLEEMVSFAARKDVGCVGARLWYPDGRLQHGGVIIGVGGVAGHAHKYFPRGHAGYFGRAVLHQALSAVTAACLLVRREVFEAVGGLDEKLVVAFNDVDFCLRVQAYGLRNVWTPFAEMVHHESASRGDENTPEKQARFTAEMQYVQARWGAALLADSAYNVNLTIEHEDYSYAWPPRRSVT